uniref:retrotransposon-derived protein PEG10 isoform X1 n=1 Tax=Doryrhamphus excisus TaxID=161450 RepID=UPI0025AE89A2|nr:retrotransposon-derived protein PEG10 isoform X1 [Doryrhamphus excisus]
MDPAELESVRQALRTQGQRQSQQEEQLAALGTALQSLSERQDAMAGNLGSQLNSLQSALQPAAQHAAPVDTAAAPLPPPVLTSALPAATCPQLSRPEWFSGESGDVRPFLTKCELHFELQAPAFMSERARVAFVISHLTGRAGAWATTEWSRRSAVCESYAAFSKALEQVFQRQPSGREAARSLLQLHQGRQRVTDYAVEFRALAANSDWNAPALLDAFFLGLSPHIRRQMIPLKLPGTIDELIALAVMIEKRLHDHEEESRSRWRDSTTHWGGNLGHVNNVRPTPVAVPLAAPSADEPMQLGLTRLSPEERTRRRSEGRCFYCGQGGHLVANCGVKMGKTSNLGHGSVSLNVIISNPALYKPLIQFCSLHTSIMVPVFVDSGSDANLISTSLARKLKLRLCPLRHPLTVKAVDGSSLGKISHRTHPVKISFPDNHTEKLSLHVFSSSDHEVILGHPWLKQHNPHFDWASGQIVSWGPGCQDNCLVSAKTVMEQGEVNLDSVPECYHDLAAVFSKVKAKSLPPHRVHDCAIDLLPGTTPPRGRLFSLSPPERRAMEEYIQESLAAGIIRPSSSPAGAGFFFVEKKDKSLRPCIDYRGLNDISIKNRYPLPLIATATELLEGAKIFTKLDLRNAYHLVRIREGDEWKTAFNTPTDIMSTW